MLCEKCGFEIPKDERVCPTCTPAGTRMRPTIETQGAPSFNDNPGLIGRLFGKLTKWLIGISVSPALAEVMKKTKGFKLAGSQQDAEVLRQQLDRLTPKARDRIMAHIAKVNPTFAQKVCQSPDEAPPADQSKLEKTAQTGWPHDDITDPISSESQSLHAMEEVS